MKANPDALAPVCLRAFERTFTGPSTRGACIGLAMAAIFLFQPILAAENAAERYTLFVAVQPPYEKNRAALQKMLKAEGYKSSAEGDEELVLVLTAGELQKLFQARVRMQTVAASATDRMITQPTLESARIPRRFEKLIERVYFDPQRS
jgi:hypothetical protein